MAVPYARSSSTLEAKRVSLGTFPTMLRGVLITEVDSGHITQHLTPAREHSKPGTHLSEPVFLDFSMFPFAHRQLVYSATARWK